MTKYSNIDYQRRPKTYQLESDTTDDLIALAFADPLWTARRKFKLRRLGLNDTLDEKGKKERLAFALIEWLPDLKPGQIEIARIDEAQVNIISIRATQSEHAIHYEMVDEFFSKFELQRKESSLPLTLEELIHLVDNSRFADESKGLSLANVENLVFEGHSRTDARRLTHITSGYYLDLELHYDKALDDWMTQEATLIQT